MKAVMPVRARGLEQLPIPHLCHSCSSDEWRPGKGQASENAKCFTLAHRSKQTKVNTTDKQKVYWREQFPCLVPHNNNENGASMHFSSSLTMETPLPRVFPGNDHWGLRPGTHWGCLDAPPERLVGWGWGCPQPTASPSTHLASRISMSGLVFLKYEYLATLSYFITT